jgi:sugar phosphate isomerase/epimerase
MPTTRREWMAGALAAAGSVWAKPGDRIDRGRIAAITDEIARSPEAAIEFAHLYGLKWLELRDVPGAKGKNYFLMDDADARVAAKQFHDGGVRISFLNTNLLKFGLPGTEPVRRTPEAPEAREKRVAREQLRFDSRADDLRRCIANAHTLDCRYLRVFAFSRVAEPRSVFPRIADALNEFAKVAEREGVVLLLENETSCNVGTCEELAAMMKLVSPNIGINWDVLNGKDMGEQPFPRGYDLLPKERIRNVQIKGRSILPEFPDKLVDWKAIFDRMAADGYKDEIGLETHIFGEGQVAASHASMRAILQIVDPAFLATLPPAPAKT